MTWWHQAETTAIMWSHSTFSAPNAAKATTIATTQQPLSTSMCSAQILPKIRDVAHNVSEEPLPTLMSQL